MMKSFLRSLILLAFTLPCHAQSRAVFWTETSALAAAKSFDAYKTRQALDRGWHERNPLLGRHPTTRKLALYNAGIFAAQALLFHKAERNRRPWVRAIGRVAIGFAIQQHLRYGVCNSLGVDAYRRHQRACW